MSASSTLSRLSGRPAAALELLRANPVLVPMVASVAIFVALGASEGGFYEIGTRQHPGLGWYPAGLMLLALLVASLIAVPPPQPVPRAVALALGLLGAYTAWSFVSITWAEQQGVAWDGANRTAIYLVVLALFALWPVTARAAAIVVGLLGLGIAGLGVVELLRADASADPILYFVDARFAEPTGYQNANSALWTIGLWPCLYLASSREVNPLLRGAALGGAGVLACLGLMAQSRGWIVALPLAALLFIAFMPGRARCLAAVGAVAAGALIVSSKLLAVHDDFTPEGLDGLLSEATTAILIVGAVLAIAGLVAALVDRRVSLSHGQSRRVNRGAVAGLAVLLAIGGALALVRVGDPVEKLSDSWQSFKDGGASTAPGGSRFTTVGTNRYDFWSVAWDRFTDRPLSGIGSENFQQDYLARGNSGEQPRYPHSLELGVLSQTGLVGGMLLFGGLTAAGLAALRTRRRGSPEAAAVAGVAGTIFAYWFLHASLDWFWEFPALTATSFAMLGLACAVGRGGTGRRDALLPRAEHRTLPRPLRLGVLVLAGAFLTFSLVTPWLAEREIERAATDWPASTANAYKRLDRASTLNPLSPKPHLVAATIAVRVEDEARAANELEEVLKIEPRTPFALAELAALASERGQKDEAERLLARAKAHAPHDEVVDQALKRVRSDGTINVRSLNESYLRTARRRVGRE